MSAAFKLVPWIGSTYDHAQLREWQISADRLAAGIVTGIDYPSPAHVSVILDMAMGQADGLTEAFEAIQKCTDHGETCDDASGLKEAIDGIQEALKDALGETGKETARADAAEKARDKFEEERDELQHQLDANEQRLTMLAARVAAFDDQHATLRDLRARQVRTGNALRLLADAMQEEET